MAFAARPGMHWRKCTGDIGIIFNVPPNALTLRSWQISMFKDYESDKKTLEGCINDEIRYLLEKMKTYNDENINLKDTLLSSTANVTHRVLFGYRRNIGDPVLTQLVEGASLVLGNSGPSILGQYVPFQKYLPFEVDNSAKKLAQGMDDFHRYCLEEIQKHKEVFDPENIKDVIDAYLLKMSKETSDSVFTEEDLKQILTDLCIAGYNNITTTILWGILFLIHNPNVQRRCKQEIIDKIGKDRQAVMSDKINLPYVEATILEIQRLGNISPTGIRECLETTEVFGYVIPAGTWIATNWSARMLDPSVFPDPEKFDPTRFLDEKGKVKNNEQLLPFGLGKRECTGQAITKQQLFLFFTTLMQKFTFFPPEGMPMPKLEGTPPAFVIAPLPFKVKITVD